jgi:tripartite-type tricarboxylate transporter receptor subunit TctC
MSAKHLIKVVSVCALGLALAAPSLAEQYPSRPVTLVVPYNPGGGADIIARLLATAMQPHLGQPVVVTNRPGGQGTIGTSEVVRAQPDGYTIALSAVATLTVQPHRQKLPYDTPDDYEPIIKAANLPIVFAVGANTQWKTMKEALDYIRANPGKIRVGTPGNGSMAHLTLTALNIKAGTKFAHVPYSSGAESVPSMLGGHIEALAVHPPEILPHTKAGTARVLGVFEEKRNANYPDMPTFRELGIDVTLGVYYPLIGPKGLPKDIRDKLYQAAKAALDDPAFSAGVKARGFVLDTKEPEAFRQELWASYRSNAEVVKELGLGKK